MSNRIFMKDVDISIHIKKYIYISRVPVGGIIILSFNVDLKKNLSSTTRMTFLIKYVS